MQNRRFAKINPREIFQNVTPNERKNLSCENVSD